MPDLNLSKPHANTIKSNIPESFRKVAPGFSYLWTLFPALIFFFAENDYYGWNHKPQSSEELICDGLVFLMCTVASASWYIAQTIKHSK